MAYKKKKPGRKGYSDQYRRDIVTMVLEGMLVVEVSRNTGVAVKSIRGWLDQYGEGIVASAPPGTYPISNWKKYLAEGKGDQQKQRRERQDLKRDKLDGEDKNNFTSGRGYPHEFKMKVITRLMTGLRISDAAREYNISRETLRKWRAELGDDPETILVIERAEEKCHQVEWPEDEEWREAEKKKCREDPWYFIIRYCWTYDAEGQESLFPEWDYLRLAMIFIITNHLSMILKSRQMLITWLEMAIGLHDIIFNNNRRVLYLSSRIDNAKEVKERLDFMYDKLPDWIRPRRAIGDRNKTTLGLVNGAKFKVLPATKSAVKSWTAFRVFMDEAPEMKECDKVFSVTKPVTDSGGYLSMIGTPEDEAGHFYEMWEDEKGLYEEVPKMPIHWTLRPDRGPEWHKTARIGYAEEDWNRQYELQFGQTEGRIYENFKKDIHVIDFDVNPEWRHFRGIDFGCTAPFVCLWMAVDQDGRWWIYDEYRKRGTLIRDHANEIHLRSEMWPMSIITYADHAHQDRLELEDEGITTKAAIKRTRYGIRIIVNALSVLPDGLPGLIIHPRCIHLVKEIPNYKWKKKGEGQPVDGNDHSLDPMRYVMTSETPILGRRFSISVAGSRRGLGNIRSGRHESRAPVSSTGGLLGAMVSDRRMVPSRSSALGMGRLENFGSSSEFMRRYGRDQG